MADIAGQYVELHALGENVHKARGIPHLGQRVTPSGVAFIYRGIQPELLAPLGELRTPTVADLFVAILTGEGTDD
jgi:ABC-2 type transport system ATP-binding protein